MDESAKNEPVDAEFEPVEDETDQSADGSPDTGKRPNKRFSRVLVIGAAIIFLVLAPTAYAVLTSMSKSASKSVARVKQADLTALTTRITALETKISANDDLRADMAALARRITDLENAAPSSAPVDLGAIESRLDALEARPVSSAQENTKNDAQLAQIQDAVAMQKTKLAALEARLDDIDTRIEAIKQNTRAQPDRAAALLTFLALDEAVRAGRPFEDERAALAKFLPNSGALDTLGAVARSGLVRPATLRDRFESMSAAVRAASTKKGEKPKGMLAKMGARLDSVISVRRVDGGGADANALLVRAQEALDKDDLTLAVHILDGLEGAQKDAAAPWLRDARARLDALVALRRVKNDLANISQGETP